MVVFGPGVTADPIGGFIVFWEMIDGYESGQFNPQPVGQAIAVTRRPTALIAKGGWPRVRGFLPLGSLPGALAVSIGSTISHCASVISRRNLLFYESGFS